MNRELIVNVNPTEISIALCEDKVLVELNKEQCQTGFAVGDIYLGKVRKIMPGLNAAFVNIGHEKDAFIHYLDLGSQFSSLQKLVASYQPGPLPGLVGVLHKSVLHVSTPGVKRGEAPHHRNAIRLVLTGYSTTIT